MVGQSMANVQLCCVAFVSYCKFEQVVLMCAVSCDFLPHLRLLKGSHVTILHHDDQGEENTGGSNLQGDSRPGR